MRHNWQKGEECLNCGQALRDENFCPNCGQLNNINKPTFKELVMDALANLFAFDSKFYLSLWPLLTKPGRLSIDFVRGRRSSFLPPIRLFVLVGVFMLATNSIVNRCERGANDNSHLRASQKPIAVIGNQDSLSIAATEQAKKALEDNDVNFSLNFSEGKAGSFIEEMYEHAKANPSQNTEQALDSLALPNSFSNRLLYSNMLKLSLMDGKEYRDYIQSNLLLILLMFIPVLALLLKGFYFYKNIYYVDHFVFSLHTQTAFFAFIIAYILLSLISDSFAILVLLLGFPVYLMLALKNFYGQRWLYTVLNFGAIVGSFFVVSAIFLLLVAVVSFLLI